MRSRWQVGGIALAMLGGPFLCLILAGEGESPAPLPGAGPQPAPAPPWQRRLTAEDAGRVKALDQKISQLREAGKYAEAREAAGALLEIRRRAQGIDHWETVNATWQVQALELIIALTPEGQRALEQARKQLAKAERLDDQDGYVAAGALFERVLPVYRRLLGEDHPDTASAYDSAAVNLNHQGKYAAANTLHHRSLDITLRLLGEDHPDTSIVCNNLAFNLDHQGRYVEAEPWYRRSLAIRRRVLGEEHPRTAVPYDNLALNLGKQGRYADAEPLVRKALTIRRQALGDEHPDTVRNVLNLAGCFFNVGQLSEAELLFRQVLAHRLRTLGENRLDTARSYAALAFCLTIQGKYADAEPLNERALAITRALLGEGHPQTAQIYNKVAANLDAQGRHAEAERLDRQALATLRAALGEDHPGTALAYNNLAFNLNAQDRYAEAEPLFRKSLAICRRALGEGHARTGACYNNVAYNLAAQGKYAGAEPLARRSLATLRMAFGEDHPRTATCYHNLAHTLAAQGEYAEAEVLWTAAANSFEATRLRASFVGLERTAFAAEQSPLPHLTAVLARNGKPVAAWDRLEANCARGLLDELARPLQPEERNREQQLLWRLHRLDERSTETEAHRHSLRDLELALALAPLIRQDTVLPLPAVRQQIEDQVEALHHERDQEQASFADLERELADKYGVANGKVYGLPRIQAQLPAHIAIVAWLDIPAARAAADPHGDHWACLVRHRGDPVWIRLPGSGRGKIWSDADNQLVQRGRKVLANPSADASGDWSELARQLAGQRLAPLEPALRRAVDGTVVTHLVVLPSPALTGIPLETLTDQYTISYAPSATMFTWLREKGPLSPSPTAPPRLLAVGDPTFAPPDTPTPPLPEPPDHGLLLTMVTPGSNAARGGLQPNDVLLRYAGTPLASRDQLAKALGTPRGEAPVPVVLWRDGKELRQTVAPGPLGVEVSTWPAADMIRARRAADHLVHGLRGAFAPLPETRREVQAIAPLFSEAQTLLGSEASEQNLARLADSGQLAGFQVIHVATHGVLDAARPMRSALILAQDHLPDPAAQVLAGEECYDGRLSTERILRTWRLNADLVTLSACDTALGQPSGGEGQLGFAQALFIAGARSLVLSLWKVDDTATALLMTRFYQNLLGKRAELAAPLSKAEALREAKHWLRTLSRDEADRLKEQLPSTPRGEKHVGDLPRPAADHPYAHPSYWAAFILIGDPGEPSPERANRVVARGIAPSWWVVLGLLAGGVLLGVILVRRWIRLVVAAPRIDPSPPS